MAKTTNAPLRTVVATTLEVIHTDNGYISPSRNATTNTMTKVLATINRTPTPNLDSEYWQFADEIIGFFRILDTLPEFQKIIKSLPDGAMYRTAVDTAKADEITPLTFPYAVAMPNLYSKLKPQKPKALNPLKSEAKIIKTGEYMGTLNSEDRFFVKLIRVGDYDPTRGGTMFEVHDRSENVGFFYEKTDKLEGVVYLGDCFAIHATPTRHAPSEAGEKHTVFRTVKVLKDTILPGKTQINPDHDATKGKFTKNVSF